MKLKEKERCPLHKRFGCCGRDGSEPKRGARREPKWWYTGPGVRQFPDGHVERSPAALKLVKDRMLAAGILCAACGEGFNDYRDAELAHRLSKGMNGWKRDDSLSNLTLLHAAANRDQGSMDLETYLANKWKPEICRSTPVVDEQETL